MGESNNMIFCLLLRLSLLCILLKVNNQFVNAEEMQVGSTALSVSEEQHGSHESNLNYRMKEIEAQNRQQKEEIVSLKIAAVRDRKFINELSGRVASLEVLGRRKRLYRLVPSNVIQ